MVATTTTTTTAAARPTSADTWTAWIVAPHSSFEVKNATGEVDLVQKDDSEFWVKATFRYTDENVLRELESQLLRNGMDEKEARHAVNDARTFTPSTENPTDLASIPAFARWFENTYGRHTLAAILHDNLIKKTPNDGALRSDTLADRFFRQMLSSVGVPYLKRWVIWAAVALRSRWAAGGLRRSSLCVWVLLAVTGIAMVAQACLQWAAATEPLVIGDWTVGHLPLLVTAAGLPFVAGLLGGTQDGASIVAAVAALWILPGVVLALFGATVYRVLERAAAAAGLR